VCRIRYRLIPTVLQNPAARHGLRKDESMNSRQATTANRCLHIDADIDVEILDESALTQAALAYVDTHPWDEAAEQATRRNEVQQDPIMAVLELWNAGEVIDGIPGLKSGIETVVVGDLEQHDAERTELDTRAAAQPPRYRMSAETIRADAVKATGFTPETLGYDADPNAGPDQATARKEAATVAGALWNAAIITTDEIFSDVATICQANDPWELGDWIIPHLPEAYRCQYTPVFAKAFAATFLDVTSRLVRGWEPPGSIAEEFALLYLLDQVEFLNDLYDLELPHGWREALEEALVQGEEHLFLLSDSPPEQDVETWFTRYDGNPIPIPYVAEQ
jgi:hypothetical protein